MNLRDLETPALVLDREKTARNISRLHERMARLGVALRPHGKTAKNIEIIEMARPDQSGGITVSTLKEAEYYFGCGIRDIVYAVGIAPVKLDRIAGLMDKGAEITVILDSMDQASVVAAKAEECGVTIPVLIELDCDGHRSGVAPGDSRLVDIGRYLDGEQGVELRGVLTHAGESYHCRSVAEIRALAEVERAAAVKSADLLRSCGLSCPVVSVGSTPTVSFAEDLTGVTEVRAGVFVFQDLVMVGLGVCAIDDIAVSVQASVIGHQKEKGWVVTDAGWSALSQDRGLEDDFVNQGYGLVCDVEGRLIDGAFVSAVNQEHGIVTAREGSRIDWTRFRIGDGLRILPNHACATCAMHGEYHVVAGTTDVVERWDRMSGW